MENDAINIDDLFGDEPSTEVSQPSVINEDLENLKKEMDTLRNQNQDLVEWKENASKFFGGNPNQDPNEQWAETVLDPNRLGGFVEQRIAAQTAKQQLESEYEKKYPELLPFREYILNDAAMIARNDAGQKTDQEYIDQAINHFQSKLQQTNSQGRRLSEQALSMDTGRSSVSPSRKLDFENMSDEEFHKVREKLTKQAWQ